jgi:hypothetical protein
VSTKHGQDLTADLLHDLTVEQSAPPARTEPPAAPAPTIRPENDGDPSPVVETALFLAPSAWSLPRIDRTDAALSVSVGPVRVRFRRR